MILPFDRRPGKATAERHNRALRRAHRAMPRAATGRQYLRWFRFAQVATSHLGRRNLARVAWPWRPRPTEPTAETRVKRGRLDRNPTALV